MPLTRKKKKLGSYPHLTVMFSITLALFVIGLFGLLVLHAARLSEFIRANFEVQVYLKREVTETERIGLYRLLSARPYVAEQDGVPQITFVSREEAAQQFIADTGEDFVQLLGQNPLRDAYLLRLRGEYLEAERLAVVAKDLRKQEGVHEVVYVESMATAIRQNLAKISLVLLTFAAVLLLADVLLINNTIKLALFSQRFLIRSMQLVGATDGFIQRPFLWRALWQGLGSGALAALLLYAVLQYALAQIPELALLQQPGRLAILCAGLLGLGVVISLVSAFLAIRRYLQMSLDELY